MNTTAAKAAYNTLKSLSSSISRRIRKNHTMYITWALRPAKAMDGKGLTRDISKKPTTTKSRMRTPTGVERSMALVGFRPTRHRISRKDPQRKASSQTEARIPIPKISRMMYSSGKYAAKATKIH